MICVCGLGRSLVESLPQRHRLSLRGVGSSVFASVLLKHLLPVCFGFASELQLYGVTA